MSDHFNTIRTLQYKLVMCRSSCSIDEQTAKWLRETLQFLQASLKEEIPEAVEKAAPFFSILEIAIQNMEEYNLEGNRKAFYVEADHVHNVPDTFEALFARDQQREAFVLGHYLQSMRKYYEENADPTFAARFQNDWNRLESRM